MTRNRGDAAEAAEAHEELLGHIHVIRNDAVKEPATAALANAVRGCYDARATLKTVGSSVLLDLRMDSQQLLERYFHATNEDVESAIAHNAASLLSDLLAHEYYENQALFLAESNFVQVAGRMLEHASSAVRMEAIRLLARVTAYDDVCRAAIFSDETVLGRVVELFDTVACGSEEEAALAKWLSEMAYFMKPDMLPLLLPFVPGMTSILRGLVATMKKCDERVLHRVLNFFVRFSRDDSPMHDQVLSSDIPQLAAALFSQLDLPEDDELVMSALAILDALLRGRQIQRFLDVGGLTAVRRRLGDPPGDLERPPHVVGMLAQLAAFGEPPQIRQQLLDCTDVVWRACKFVFDHLLVLGMCDSNPPGSEEFMALLQRLGRSGDVDHVRQAIQKQNVLHALAFTLALPDRGMRALAMATLQVILARVGMAFCQQYVRGLLAERAFYPLVDKYHLNLELEDTVFSAVVKSRQFRTQAQVVDLLVLLGVKETEVFEEDDDDDDDDDEDDKVDLDDLPRIVPDYYQRFRQAEVMVMLCAMRTMAKDGRRAMGLPEELWRMVHEMSCSYGPIVEREIDEDG